MALYFLGLNSVFFHVSSGHKAVESLHHLQYHGLFGEDWVTYDAVEEFHHQQTHRWITIRPLCYDTGQTLQVHQGNQGNLERVSQEFKIQLIGKIALGRETLQSCTYLLGLHTSSFQARDSFGDGQFYVEVHHGMGEAVKAGVSKGIVYLSENKLWLLYIS